MKFGVIGLFKKVIVLHSAAAVGFQKFIILFFVAKSYGVEYAGWYAAQVSLVYFIVLGTSLGFSTKLLKEIPGANDDYVKRVSSEVFTSVLLIWGWVALFLYTLFSDVSFSILLFLLANSLYQVLRHIGLSKRNYKALFLWDNMVLFSQVLLIFCLDDSNYLFYASLLFISVIMFWWYYEKLEFKFLRLLGLNKDILIYTLNNVAGSGVLNVLPFILSLWYQEALVAKLTMAILTINIAVLVIRAYLTYNIPNLVESYNLGVNYREVLIKTENGFYLILVITLILLLLLYFILGVGATLFPMIGDYYIEPSLFLGVVAFIFFSLLGSVKANSLFVMSMQHVNLWANILYFILFILFCMLVDKLGGVEIVTFLLILASISLTRLPVLYYCHKKFLKSV